MDLAVTQNGAATRLFHNKTSPPGLRVELKGPPQNPQGIGSAVRWHQGGRWSGVQEVQGGGGYWSQNAAALLFATQNGAGELEVRWPGGRVSRAQVPAGARQITVAIEP
jgi:hypothetical protein